MARITVIDLDDYEKREYTKWCVDHAEGRLGPALRLFIQWVIQRRPTWAEIVEALPMDQPEQGGGDG